MDFRKYKNRRIRHFFITPFIWAPLVPIIVLDTIIEVYHRLCFPLYGFAYVKRSRYIRIDRHKLAYLKLHEKLFCVYCGYVNGWFAYASAIAANTEQYWCGIKHENIKGTYQQPHHKKFAEYGDKKSFETQYLKAQ